MNWASPTEWLALSVLGLVFVLSAVCQIRWSGEKRLRALDLFSWLPSYNFFAPNPGVHDFHLLYRDRLPQGGVTGWRELPLTRGRGWLDCLWNPGRRCKKALYDAAGDMLGASAKGLDIRWSASYLLLLTYVSGLPRLHEAEGTQFLIMRSSPATPEVPPREIMHSDFHPR